MIFDCFPFFNELDVLEVRLHELAGIVDKTLVIEAMETYGGDSKPSHLARTGDRFRDFYVEVKLLGYLQPECKDRTSGRLREAFQRDALLPMILSRSESDDDIVIFSDCDEIPSAAAVCEALPKLKDGIHRFKQRSFYYNVNTLVDYGHDFASRARIGTVAQLKAVGSLYNFRMAPALEIENGGWHFGYFGGRDRIKQKVAALSPFLAEYKLFGDQQLEADIRDRKDLHHRRCEMPEKFWPARSDDPTLPQYLLDNPERFAHFHG